MPHPHTDPTHCEQHIAAALFECAQLASPSQDKRHALLGLPQLVLPLAEQIATEQYHPQAYTVFAVTDPKLREIFAPAFADRLVQHWLVRQIEPGWDKRFIDDSYANRRGKGTQAAIARLQRFMRQPGQRWVMHLDIAAFFPSIDRRILLGLWRRALPGLPLAHTPEGLPPDTMRPLLDAVCTAILTQSPTQPPPRPSGQRHLLAQVPPHKSLFAAPPNVGLPIGSLTSQFFANVYLNELDQFVKHRLKARAYLRYVDDFCLLADDPATLLAWKVQIEAFLHERLRLRLHPHKVVLQRCTQGLDFLGQIVFPHHSLVRQRSVRALRRRIRYFWHLLHPAEHPFAGVPQRGAWQRWLALHPVHSTSARGLPEASTVFLQRVLATLNSYYGQFGHAQTFTLRQHIYHHELGPLQRYFLPADAAYSHLKIRTHWLLRPP